MYFANYCQLSFKNPSQVRNFIVSFPFGSTGHTGPILWMGQLFNSFLDYYFIEVYFILLKCVIVAGIP